MRNSTELQHPVLAQHDALIPSPGEPWSLIFDDPPYARQERLRGLFDAIFLRNEAFFVPVINKQNVLIETPLLPKWVRISKRVALMAPLKRRNNMNLKISYKHLESTNGIDDVTRKKSEKLKKYFQGKLNLNWNFTVEKQAHIAHCHLTGDHIEFFAEATTENLYAAIDEVIHHLERQVRKNKEQLKNKKGAAKEIKAA